MALAPLRALAELSYTRAASFHAHCHMAEVSACLLQWISLYASATLHWQATLLASLRQTHLYFSGWHRGVSRFCHALDAAGSAAMRPTPLQIAHGASSGAPSSCRSTRARHATPALRMKYMTTLQPPHLAV
eukprot:7166035-Pyramimonas_sp.AAC.1